MLTLPWHLGHVNVGWASPTNWLFRSACLARVEKNMLLVNGSVDQSIVCFDRLVGDSDPIWDADMSDYLRYFVAGGACFFTVVTHHR